MGDMKEEFEALRKIKKQGKNIRFEENLKVFNESNLNNFMFDEPSKTLFFREKNKPKVDFYLSTGCWKVKNKIFRGGAKSFISWYGEQ